MPARTADMMYIVISGIQYHILSQGSSYLLRQRFSESFCFVTTQVTILISLPWKRLRKYHNTCNNINLIALKKPIKILHIPETRFLRSSWWHLALDVQLFDLVHIAVFYVTAMSRLIAYWIRLLINLIITGSDRERAAHTRRAHDTWLTSKYPTWIRPRK